MDGCDRLHRADWRRWNRSDRADWYRNNGLYRADRCGLTSGNDNTFYTERVLGSPISEYDQLLFL
jgi:hypothetical protein